MFLYIHSKCDIQEETQPLLKVFNPQWVPVKTYPWPKMMGMTGWGLSPLNYWPDTGAQARDLSTFP